MTNEIKRLGDYMFSRRSKGEVGLPTLSVTLDRGLVPRDTLERKTDTNLSPREHLRVLPGDIAYNMMRMWQGASGLAENEAIVSPAYVVLAPKENLDPRFAAYLFKTPRMIHSFWAYSYGLTNDRLRLYPKDALKVPVDIPPLPEQKKIAEILQTWDKAIETSEALLATARTQKRALMQTLLTGKRRFPEFEGQDWREVRLGEVAEIFMGSSPKSSAYNDEGIGLPLIQGNADIKNGRSAPRSHTSEITTTCRQGDILLSVRAPVGTVAISDHEACVGRGVAVIRPRQATDCTWLKHVMFSLEDKWASVSQGSTFEAVNSKDIKGFTVSVSYNVDEQRMIGAVLETSELECLAITGKIEKLRTEKKALMQQLLTGKRRVVV